MHNWGRNTESTNISEICVPTPNCAPTPSMTNTAPIFTFLSNKVPRAIIPAASTKLTGSSAVPSPKVIKPSTVVAVIITVASTKNALPCI